MISRLPGLSLPERAWGVVRRWALAWWRILYLGAVVCVLVLSPSSYGRSPGALWHATCIWTPPRCCWVLPCWQR